MTEARNKKDIGEVTLEDVARLVGVSAITVSRALNTPEKVAETTREKIRQAVERLGYVPNRVAGALSSRSSKLVAAIVPTIINPIYAETVSHFSEAMRQAGYEVLLGESGAKEEEAQEEALVTAILSRRPDGLLLTGVKHSAKCCQQLLASGIPVVEIWEVSPNPFDVVVGFSHEKLGEQVAQYFLERGFHDAAVVSAGDRRALIRAHAFSERMRAATGKTVRHVRTHTPSTYHDGREALRELLAQGFRRGGIFCSSDALAHGILTEARQSGIAIPDDIGVMGFGDLAFSACTAPPLSTVYLDREKVGSQAAEKLLKRIRGEEMVDKVLDVGFAMVTRETM